MTRLTRRMPLAPDALPTSTDNLRMTSIGPRSPAVPRSPLAPLPPVVAQKKAEAAAPVAAPSAPSVPAREVAEKYFAALNARDAGTLESLYAPHATFRDNVFRHADRAGSLKMWAGLPKDARVKHEVIGEKDGVVTAKLVWDYTLAGKKVRNEVLSELTIVDGRIVTQREKFDFGAWASQLVPLPRKLLNFAEPVLAPTLRMIVG